MSLSQTSINEFNCKEPEGYYDLLAEGDRVVVDIVGDSDTRLVRVVDINQDSDEIVVKDQTGEFKITGLDFGEPTFYDNGAWTEGATIRALSDDSHYYSPAETGGDER